MNSKLILLLGGLLSSMIVYFCLNSQYKNQLLNPIIKKSHLEKNEKEKKEKIEQKIITPPIAKKIDKQPEPKPHREQINEINKTQIEVKLQPYIYYIPNKQISLLLPKDEDNRTKDFYKNICNNKTCIKDIQFKENALKAKWIDIAMDTISFFKDNNISNAIINSSDDILEVNATFKDENKYNDFKKSIISVIDKSLMKSNIVLNKEEKKEIKDTNESDTIDTSKVQEDINQIIKKYPIYFRSGSNILTKRGKKSLWKIVKILRKNKNIMFTILVTGHTNRTGDERFNKILSQKRADTVRWYLKQRVKNIKSISAAGFGSSRPKIKNNPRNRKNRRVEIIIKKGTIYTTDINNKQ